MGKEKNIARYAPGAAVARKNSVFLRMRRDMFIVRITPAICPLKIRILMQRLKKISRPDKKIIVQLAVASSK